VTFPVKETMTFDKRLVLVLLVPGLLTCAVYAQEIPRPASSSPPKITLDVVVTQKLGQPVPGLQEQDFKILDNKSS